MQVSQQIKIAVTNSAKFARMLGSSTIEIEHLFFGLLLSKTDKSVKLLNDLGITSESFKNIILKRNNDENKELPNAVSYSYNINKFLAESAYVCDTKNVQFLTIDNAIYFILSNNDYIPTKILTEVFKINLKNLLKNLESIVGFSVEIEEQNTASVSNNTGDLPEALKNLGIDLTKKIANENNFEIIGRDTETEKVIEILCRKTKNNPVLIGEPGVGKSSVIEGLARRINLGNVPENLMGKTIFSFDISSLISGSKFRGSMEQKLKDAITCIQENKNILVFIDEIHTLVQAGAKEGEVSPADILKPYLARGELHCIGATTSKEYKDYIEKDPALERRFQPVKVEEPSEQDAIKILRGIKNSFENFHNVKIDWWLTMCKVNHFYWYTAIFHTEIIVIFL